MNAIQPGDVRALSEFVSSFLEPASPTPGTSATGTGLSLVKWRQFWETLFPAENATGYLAVLITRLASVEVGDKSPLPEAVRKLVSGEYLNFNTKDMKPLQEPALNRFANLETVLFCALFLPFSPGDAHFRTALTYWNNVRFSVDVPPYSKGTMRGSRQSHETEDGLGRFITELIQMLKNGRAAEGLFADYVTRIKDVDCPSDFDFTDENCNSRMVGNALFNPFVMSQLRSSWSQGTAVLEVMQKMLGKVSVVNEVDRPKLHCFLLQLRLYLTQCPFWSEDFLREAVYLFKQLYLVPRPVGDVARDMLHMLTLEFKAPGETLRRAMFAEVPELAKAPVRGIERQVHVFADLSNRQAMLVLEMVRMQHISEPDLVQMKLDILNHILRQDEAYAKAPAAGLERLPPEEIARYYDDAIELMNACVRTEPQRVEEYRRSELRDLIVDVELAVELLDAPPPAGVPLPGLQLAPPRIPTIPPLVFQTDSFFADNALDARLDPKLPLIPRRASCDLLVNTLMQYQPFATPKSHPVAKIGIVGSDAAVHNVLCGYVYTRLYSSHVLDNVDVQFYFIPAEHSEFAAFLAQHDAWYAQQVLMGIKCLLRIWPTLSVPERSEFRLSSGGSGRGSFEPEVMVRTRSSSRGAGTIPPSKPLPDDVFTPDAVLRGEIESLFRDARFKTELRVYQCECWSSSTEPAIKADYAIPFVQRAEIGVKPAKASMMNSSSSGKGAGLAAGGSRPDTPSQKTFKFTTPVLSIKFTYSNCLGETREGQKLDPRSYHSITLASTPIPGLRVRPNPTKPWLELFLLESDEARRKRGGAEDNHHVANFECESADDKKRPFNILLDGVLYGPFLKIRVSPLLDVPTVGEQEQLTFPIMTFLPLDFNFVS